MRRSLELIRPIKQDIIKLQEKVKTLNEEINYVSKLFCPNYTLLKKLKSSLEIEIEKKKEELIKRQNAQEEIRKLENYLRSCNLDLRGVLRRLDFTLRKRKRIPVSEQITLLREKYLLERKIEGLEKEIYLLENKNYLLGHFHFSGGDYKDVECFLESLEKIFESINIIIEKEGDIKKFRSNYFNFRKLFGVKSSHSIRGLDKRISSLVGLIRKYISGDKEIGRKVKYEDLKQITELIIATKKINRCVVQIGSFLFVKSKGQIFVRDLSLKEIKFLKEKSTLLHNPDRIITVLNMVSCDIDTDGNYGAGPIRTLIANNNIIEAIDGLKVLVSHQKKKEFLDEIVIVEANYNRIRREIRLGLSSKFAINQINNSLLSILSEIEKVDEN